MMKTSAQIMQKDEQMKRLEIKVDMFDSRINLTGPIHNVLKGPAAVNDRHRKGVHSREESAEGFIN